MPPPRIRPRLPAHAGPSRPLSTSRPLRVSDTQVFQLPTGRIKLSLAAPHLVGRAQSRGERPYQEDTFRVASVSLPRAEIVRSLPKPAAAELPRDWHGGHAKGKGKGKADQDDGEGATGSGEKEEVVFAAVFDGHNGKEASTWLKDSLADLVESSTASQAPGAIRAYRDLGGYFRRFRGGYLEDLAGEVWDEQPSSSDGGGKAASEATGKPKRDMDLGERLTLSFILADQHLCSAYPQCGSVATSVLLCPLPSHPAPPDPPTTYPFHSSPGSLLAVAHIGDTRALLCAAASGRVVKLTEEHHPDSRVEAERLRRVGTGLVTDSFGESRWGGALANTRGLGDAKFKRIGVTGEPQIDTRVLKGEEWAFLVIVSDGVSEVMSDQEIVDLCRDKPDPTKAAEAIIDFAEQVGAQDNMTVVVLPLAGWRKLGGTDSTASRREYRLRQSSGQSARARRM